MRTRDGNAGPALAGGPAFPLVVGGGGLVLLLRTSKLGLGSALVCVLFGLQSESSDAKTHPRVLSWRGRG